MQSTTRDKSDKERRWLPRSNFSFSARRCGTTQTRTRNGFGRAEDAGTPARAVASFASATATATRALVGVGGAGSPCTQEKARSRFVIDIVCDVKFQQKPARPAESAVRERSNRPPTGDPALPRSRRAGSRESSIDRRAHTAACFELRDERLKRQIDKQGRAGPQQRTDLESLLGRQLTEPRAQVLGHAFSIPNTVGFILFHHHGFVPSPSSPHCEPSRRLSTQSWGVVLILRLCVEEGPPLCVFEKTKRFECGAPQLNYN